MTRSDRRYFALVAVAVSAALALDRSKRTLLAAGAIIAIAAPPAALIYAG